MRQKEKEIGRVYRSYHPCHNLLRVQNYLNNSIARDKNLYQIIVNVANKRRNDNSYSCMST